jgi:putative transposase
MPQYIHALVPGGMFFFTVTLLERRRKLLAENIDNLRQVFKAARRRRPFTIEAIVILPDHLHCICTLPSGDTNFSTRWHDIKARFAAKISGGERLSMLKAGCASLSRPTVLEFKRIYHENWIIQRHGYQTPAQARREQSQALPQAA